jgi:hypothetical protein
MDQTPCAGETVQFWLLDTRNVFKECRQDEEGIHFTRVYNLATTTCAKAFMTYIRVAVPAPNVIAVYVFGTGIFH